MVVYSTDEWGHDAQLWVQSNSLDPYSYSFATEPHSVIHHEQSGNIIMTVGVRGVIVGTSDGEWTPVEIGPYKLADFSPLAKSFVLLSDLVFLLSTAVLAVCFSMLAFVLSKSKNYTPGAVFATIVTGISILPLSLFGIVSVEDRDNNEVIQRFTIIFLVVSFICALVVVPTLLANIRRWRQLVVILLFMTHVVIVIFIVWIQVGFPLPIAKALAIGLVALMAIERARALRRS